jgi:hypothetical protein
MTWNYQIKKTTYNFEGIIPSEYDIYSLREVYYDDNGKATGYTEDDITPKGDSHQELVEILERMLDDAKKGLVFSGDDDLSVLDSK